MPLATTIYYIAQAYFNAITYYFYTPAINYLPYMYKQVGGVFSFIGLTNITIAPN